MEIVENNKLFKVLLLTRAELISTGGYSISDSCNKPMEEGYYIGVLNMTYCKADYQKWNERAINYPEDQDYENFAFNRMHQFITNFFLIK